MKVKWKVLGGSGVAIEGQRGKSRELDERVQGLSQTENCVNRYLNVQTHLKKNINRHSRQIDF